MSTAADGFTGEQAKRARELLGLSQFDVASAVGVTPQHISNFERGRSDLSVRVRHYMARLLGLQAPDYVDPPESPIAELNRRIDELSRQMDEVLSLIRREHGPQSSDD